MQGDNYTTIDKYLKDCYESGYIGTMYSIANQGIPIITPIDQSAVVRAVLTDSKVSNGLYNALGVNVDKLKKTITQEISRGIATGMGYADMARNISNVSKAPLSRTKTIARTEGHRIQQTSTADAQQAAKAKGADVLKQWDAALDGRTRESHRQMDGEIRELNEKFSNGLMFPGDPNGGAAEVVNCRCTMLTRARAALDESELKTLKDRAAYFGLDKTENFKDFENKYLNASKVLEKSGKSDIIKITERRAFNSLSADLSERSKQVDQLLNRHSTRKSKWSGKTIVKKANEMPYAMGAKEWSCDIILREDSGIKTAVHEHLHARSCSYYASDVYKKWKAAEEGAVELFAQEICKKNGVSYNEAYIGVVKQLRIANSIMRGYDSEYEFAKAFFEVELPDRYMWIRRKADALINEGKLSDKTVRALNAALNSLYKEA